MLHTLKDLTGFAIHAADGYLGFVKDFYFDDKRWVVRYLVIETGSWFSSKQLLISPLSIQSISREDKTIKVNVSVAQMINSPITDPHKPISRQFETEYLSYYGYPMYWIGTELWGGYLTPTMVNTASVGNQAYDND